jgi:hypothetical protein
VDRGPLPGSGLHHRLCRPGCGPGPSAADASAAHPSRPSPPVRIRAIPAGKLGRLGEAIYARLVARTSDSNSIKGPERATGNGSDSSAVLSAARLRMKRAVCPGWLTSWQSPYSPPQPPAAFRSAAATAPAHLNRRDSSSPPGPYGQPSSLVREINQYGWLGHSSASKQAPCRSAVLGPGACSRPLRSAAKVPLLLRVRPLIRARP